MKSTTRRTATTMLGAFALAAVGPRALRESAAAKNDQRATHHFAVTITIADDQLGGLAPPITPGMRAMFVTSPLSLRLCRSE